MPVRTDDLLVLCPLAVEAVSVRLGLRGGRVVRAGMRARRGPAVRSALRRLPGVPVAVVGVAGALNEGARPGDLVVPDVVRSSRGEYHCSSATTLVAELRRRRRKRCTVHTGELVQSDRVVRRLGATPSDAVALDLESALLLDLADDGRDVVVLRAVADTPERPLLSPATLPGGVAALAALRASGPALRSWAATVARGKNDSNDSVVNDSVVKEVRHP
ncbi:hypothetical protein AB8O38_00215 [Saccharomonospora xinjiangensis]|uniref:hypothetical protein n=1 Tax=Saccharomonospora xinjiangensis TaxID=75294 RepID=UPI00350FF1FC